MVARNFTPKSNVRRIIQANFSYDTDVSCPKPLKLAEKLVYTQQTHKHLHARVRDALLQTQELLLWERSRKQWIERVDRENKISVKRIGNQGKAILHVGKQKIDLGVVIL